ncbi:uncharacterized protein CLAFUR5_05412 [Fulvia fulva]|uniref:Uncharacterized protein n=1 Tax=Passalora fulva TaxID=5499 RepID=A0A9Q8LHT8_PASFU|nr:uncharacterized protein CLAFUR5_05412 [Fulvia fulva]KAK4624866.1 hypothetical protein CLAFUR0_05265 [Fulvia fulva]UJO17750.1 hypothetical protein CLAFUR5_05412 [Fulvia fulva]
MRTYTLATAFLAGCALATPVPQDLDWDAIESLDPIETPSIPVVDAKAAETTMAYVSAAAASAVASAVAASPEDSTITIAGRGIAEAVPRNNANCTRQPAANDTPKNFSARYSSNATEVSGYTTAYFNRNGSSEGVYGYMGYSVLDTYNPSQCAERCNANKGCSSFNIYYERDPSVTPKDGCSNPPSTVVIKCVYYGGPVTPQSATNVGQYQGDFHVVIAGSNGYVRKSIATPDGYSGLTALGNGAIQAPLDCNGKDTYMGVKIFQGKPFDTGLCAAACTAQSKYNREHPGKNGYFQTCQFFNTYVLYNGTTAVGQYCSLYNETWPASFATNVGQWRGKDYFSIGYSYSFSNSTGGVDKPTGCNNPTSPK